MRALFGFFVTVLISSIFMSNARTLCIISSNPFENIGNCVPNPRGGGDICSPLALGSSPCSGTVIVIDEK